MATDYQGHILGPQLDAIPKKITDATKQCANLGKTLSQITDSIPTQTASLKAQLSPVIKEQCERIASVL